MKNKLKILNSKEIKEIKKLLKEQFGFDNELDYVFLQNEKGKIFLVTKDISKIDFEKLRINNVGLYFCHIKDSKLRLSIDGSQLIGNHCSKNILEIENKEVKGWMRGEEISATKKFPEGIFLIIKSDNDFLGCGKYYNGNILNFVSKARRIYAN